MSDDDYLWDRRGPPDAEAAHLEQLLERFGLQTLPPIPSVSAPLRASPSRRLLWLAAAALVAISGAGWWLLGRSRAMTAGWQVVRFAEARPSAAPNARGAAELRVGGWLETASGETANVKVADIGTVDVEPRTRIRLVRSGTGHHQLELARGTLHAVIWAPPGQFVVDTPSSTVVDLGCAYTLTVDDSGAGLVTVTFGWVGFEWQGRESFVPAGAVCVTRP